MYIYAADTWCDSCGERIRAELLAEGSAPVDPSDEYSYDSDDFPKGPFPLEETDGPNHCAAQGDCLEPVDLTEWGLAESDRLLGAESARIGALLSSGLTDYGVSYLREMLEEPEPTPYQRALYRFWQAAFSDELG